MSDGYLVGVAERDPYALNILFSIICKYYSTLFSLLFAGTVAVGKIRDYNYQMKTYCSACIATSSKKSLQIVCTAFLPEYCWPN